MFDARLMRLIKPVIHSFIHVHRYSGRLDMSRVAGANITLDPRFLPDVTDSHPQLNLEDLVACRLMDVDSGLVLDPLTRRRLTLSEAAKDGGLISGEATVVVNLESGARMSLSEALDTGLINGQTGRMTLSVGEQENKGEISGVFLTIR